MLKRYFFIILASGLMLAGCSKKHSAAITEGNDTNGNSSAQSYGMGDAADIEGSDGLYARVKNTKRAPSEQTYYFSFDGSRVNDEDMPYIIAQANYLVAHKNAKIRLEGNTDNRGSREYNIGLGWRRDNAVARILQMQGVRPAQINMISLGKEKPAVLGDNEQAWRLNRRVHLVYED